jgi:hypothetical protein
MSLTSGFFNSINNDRMYDAEQFSSFLDGIVYDGVYGAYGNCFYVMSDESEDLGIIIDTGRAWFNHTWTLNDTYYNLTMPEADLLLDRIDAVVIEVNKVDRQNSFQVVQGTPAESPVRPTLKGRSGEVTEEIYQYAIAYIARPAASTEVTQDQIVYVVDTSETPLCSALALAGIPSGGTIGQVLAKKSSESAAVGWYDVGKLPYDKWYLVDGIMEENVIAAYRFKGMASMDAALQNVNLNGSYPLDAVGITFVTDKGLFFPASINKYINSTSLINQKSSIITCAFGYSDMDTGKVGTAGTFISATSPWKYLWAKCGRMWNPESPQYGYYNHTMPRESSNGYLKQSSSIHTEGCLACDWSKYRMWYNGAEQSMSNASIGTWGIGAPNGRVFSTPSQSGVSCGSMYLSALVYYNVVLTNSQHIQLANQINSL